MREQVRVLYVEDNPPDATLILSMLEGGRLAHYETDVHYQLADGVAAAQDGNYNVALLDLNLPESRGIETVDRFVAEVPNVPVVVLTGLDDDELGRQALKHGAQDFILKGEFTAAVLERCLMYAIERFRLSQKMDQQTTEIDRLSKKVRRMQAS